MLQLLSKAAPFSGLVLLGWQAAATAGTLPATASCEAGSPPAYFFLSQYGGDASQCTESLDSPLEEIIVDVILVPSKKVRFSIPDPPFGTVQGETWNFPHTGDRIHGLELDLGDCSGSYVRLGVLTVLIPNGITGCVPWKVDDGCEIADCAGAVRTGVAWEIRFSNPATWCYNYCWQWCRHLPPYNLLPADGAVGVATDAVLSWTQQFDTSLPPEAYESMRCSVRFGTDPACDAGQEFVVPCNQVTFAPNFLQPSTKYFWRTTWLVLAGSGCSNASGGMSPIYSFTTAPPIAVNGLTWGRVKSLYRE